MAVIKAGYAGSIIGNGGSSFIRLSGTIAEVLQKAADMGFSTGQKIFYTDDGTSAIAVFCDKE